jgi:hypothetical protein
LPLQTHPKVTVAAGSTKTDFIASVVAPGAWAPSALVLLLEKASALVEHVSQSVPELDVMIVEPHRSFQGVIPVADISTAMQTLQSGKMTRNREGARVFRGPETGRLREPMPPLRPTVRRSPVQIAVGWRG